MVAVRTAAMRRYISSMDAPWLALSLIAALCLASASLWVALWRRRRGLRRLNERRSRIPPISLGAIAITAVWLLHQLAVNVDSLLRDAPAAPFSPEAVQNALRLGCVIQAAALAFLWLALIAGSSARAVEFGVTTRDLGRQLRGGLLTVTAAWLPVFGVLVASYPLRSEERQHAVLRLLQEQPSLEAYAWAVLSAVVLAPLFEEVVFRVSLQSWLTERLGCRPALLITSLIFAAVHGFPDSLAIIPLALVLGSAWQLTQRYWVIVTAHALFNAVMLFLDALLPGS